MFGLEHGIRGEFLVERPVHCAKLVDFRGVVSLLLTTTAFNKLVVKILKSYRIFLIFEETTVTLSFLKLKVTAYLRIGSNHEKLSQRWHFIRNS